MQGMIRRVPGIRFRIGQVEARQLGRNDLPLPAALGQPEEVVSAQIQHLWIIARDEKRCVPVPAELPSCFHAGVFRRGPNDFATTRKCVAARNVRELRFRKTILRRIGRDGGVEAVATEYCVPIVVGASGSYDRARWPATYSIGQPTA